ncbi:MAG: hypothetical protein K0U86_10050 [Planctomycetes bacterium]|nr:hypothetical protein [Planctomycetota bacterium]MCH9725232.1 hypothetical protein [Planctomycetota bacterium]MCH9779430.1 hypothetical protein [Planctomycetota bacterium]MCH9792558.1 hypothetical protein [Planctomycetota bacterium]
MKPFDTSGMLENNDELESVLRDYFQQEMPPELLEIPEVSDEEYEKRFMQMPRPDISSPDRFEKRQHRQFTISLLIVGLCVCLMIGFSVSRFLKTDHVPVVNNSINQLKPNQPTENASDSKNLESAESVAVIDQGDTPLEVSDQKNVHESIDLTLYNTEHGPIEQRTEISWTNITFQNHKTGTNMEMSMPELTIDFVPVSKARLSLINEEENGNEQ